MEIIGTETEKNNKISTLTIDLGECKKKLKSYYEIPQNEQIYIFK